MKDRDLGLECLKAFNDWLLEDFCSVDPRRLIGMSMIPWEHPIEVATAELERVLKKGAKAVFLPYSMAPNPPIHAPYWDPVRQLITGADAVASVHLRFGGTRPPDPPLPDGLKTNWLGSVNIVMGYFSAIQPLTEMIYTGLFERFPTLKFVHAEVDWGWVPFWTEIMDQVVRQHSYWVDWPMQRKPSEYFGRNVFVTGLDDVEGFRQARHVENGYEKIARGAMFSIDYPHEISLFGSTQQVLSELTQGLDDNVKRAILAGNAMRVYNLTDETSDSAFGLARGRFRQLVPASRFRVRLWNTHRPSRLTHSSVYSAAAGIGESAPIWIHSRYEWTVARSLVPSIVGGPTKCMRRAGSFARRSISPPTYARMPSWPEC